MTYSPMARTPAHWLFPLLGAVLLSACGGAEKRLVEHTSARAAPPLVATDAVFMPTPSGRYALPAGVTPVQHDAETLKRLERPPEMAAAPEPLPAERAGAVTAELVEAEVPYLELSGSYERHWGRLESALSAGGFSVRDRRPGEGTLRVRYAEAGGDVSDAEGTIYQLRLRRGDESHRLTVQDAEGGPVPSRTAREILEIIRDRL